MFDIEACDLIPKPQPRAFARLIERHGVTPRTAAFFEDLERNLEPAAALGMTTVLVGPRAAECTSDFVHHRTERLSAFLGSARLKEAA